MQPRQIVNGTEFADAAGSNARLVREVDSGKVRYLATRGRGAGGEQITTLARFAVWAADYIR